RAGRAGIAPRTRRAPGPRDADLRGGLGFLDHGRVAGAVEREAVPGRVDQRERVELGVRVRRHRPARPHGTPSGTGRVGRGPLADAPDQAHAAAARPMARLRAGAGALAGRLRAATGRAGTAGPRPWPAPAGGARTRA